MQDDENEMVAKVVPIATSFDLRVVAAPAVAVEVISLSFFGLLMGP